MHNNTENIQEYLGYYQRQRLITDIKKVYPGSSRWRTVLYNMSDGQLLAFRGSLTKQRKLNGTGRNYGIHLNVIMTMYGAKDYLVQESIDRTNLIYIGNYLEEKDKFGNAVNLQYGIIETDQDWKIISMEVFGLKVHRYDTMKLFTNWNHFE